MHLSFEIRIIDAMSQWVWNVIALLWIAIVFFLIVMYIDDHRFVIREYDVHTSRVSHPLTFVFMSDLHSKDHGDGNRKVLESVDSIRPDAVLIGGDMIISSKAKRSEDGWMQVSLNITEALASKYPVYLSNGNHEDVLHEEEIFRPLYDRYMEEMEKRGAIPLHNTSEVFHGVRIYGLELPHSSYGKVFPVHVGVEDVEACIGTCCEDSGDPEFKVVLAHNPKFFPAYAQWGADLVLSGHVHGGLMKIGKLGFIAPDLHLFPKYCAGKYTLPKGNKEMSAKTDLSTLIVSCGLGEHTLPIRIFNPAELSVVRLTPGKPDS